MSRCSLADGSCLQKLYDVTAKNETNTCLHQTSMSEVVFGLINFKFHIIIQDHYII